MRQLILGIGLAVGTAIAIAAVVANAAVGDAVYVKRDAERYALPVGVKRTSVANLLTECYPSLGISTFKALRCSRMDSAVGTLIAINSNWRCYGTSFTASPTDAQRLDLILAGAGSMAFSASDALVELAVCSATTSTVDALTEAVFTRDETSVAEFLCERGTGTPSCTESPVISAAPSVWVADYRAGNVIGTIGKVE